MPGARPGLLLVLVEEALRASVPVILIDVKGDLSNLLLTFPELSAQQFAPWVDARAAARSGSTSEEVAQQLAVQWRQKLAEWRLGPDAVAAQRESVAGRVFTPGSQAGEPLSVLSSLERRSPLWDTDLEVAREALSASISLLLRLMGRDPDPTRSRDHVLLSIFAERRLRAGQPADVAALLEDVRTPPIANVGAMAVNDFVPKRDRQALATGLNPLLASPTFESWRAGAPLAVESWLAPRSDGRTSATIVSVAHLDDEERSLVLGLLLEQTLAWVRTQQGTEQLRALLVFDEVYGFVPPHPANPPTKRPIVSLMKQARAFGLGVVLATQNPMDLDYRALSNAGLWCIGRLATDADRQRVVEAMADAAGSTADAETLGTTLKMLAPRWFLLRNAHRASELWLLQSRTTLCWLRGPLTRTDLRRLAAVRPGRRPA